MKKTEYQQQQDQLSKFRILQSRLEAIQFIYKLDARTSLPHDVIAPACFKTVSTLRSDITRKPKSLPRITRRGGRVGVIVSDLIAWQDARPAEPLTSDQPSKKRGRTTNAMRLTDRQFGVKPPEFPPGSLRNLILSLRETRLQRAIQNQTCSATQE